MKAKVSPNLQEYRPDGTITSEASEAMAFKARTWGNFWKANADQRAKWKLWRRSRRRYLLTSRN